MNASDLSRAANRIPRSSHDILRILLAQAAAGVVVALIVGVVAGLAALVSALIGAVAYLLPNAVFAVRLLLGLASTGQANVLTFFLGEFVKLALAVAVLMLAGWFGRSWLVWSALLLGLCGVLMGYALLPLVSRLLRARS